MINFRDKANKIWAVADLLRGRYKQSDYGKVILPFTALSRFDIVLAPTREAVWSAYERHKTQSDEILEPVLNKAAGLKFHNRSKLDFKELIDDHNHIGTNLRTYINSFSKSVKDIFFTQFKFDEEIAKLERFNILYDVAKSFYEEKEIFASVTHSEMGYIYEELIRKFAESSNETAGEHFTPREIIRLMVNLLFKEDRDELTKTNIVKTLYDPACGTGGMLSLAEQYLKELNDSANLILFGQEINPESFGMCQTDMLIKGHEINNIKFGDTFTEDRLADKRFDYSLSNPPFGVDWKTSKDFIEREHEQLGYDGRFGAGYPPISDGSFLFLQTMIDKMKPASEGGSRIAIVFNGSPLFSGGAGSGPSNIRRWIIENDWLEAIIAMPDQLFYNTGISTYVWILSNNKHEHRRGEIQLINATGSEYPDKNNPFFFRMTKSLGNKRKEIGDGQNGRPDQIATITNLFYEFEENEFVKLYENHFFGYWRITVERPLRLNFQVNEERKDNIKAVYDNAKDEYEKAVAEITDESKRKEQEKAAFKKFEKSRAFTSEEIDDLLSVLLSFDAEKLYKDRAVFLKDFDKTTKALKFKLSASQRKLVLNLLSERDQTAEICRDKKGEPEADSELRDYENIPLASVPAKDAYGNDRIDFDTINEYFAAEVLPHVPDAWIDWSKTKVGYEINFTKYFYKYKPLRSLDEIRADILALEAETEGMIRQVIEA